MSHVTSENEGSLAVITLDNPPQNTIGVRLVGELAAVIETVEAGNFRAVLLRAKGQDFSFGGDFISWPDLSPRQLRATLENYMMIFNRFERLSRQKTCGVPSVQSSKL
jgi:enoyl-CoA hydratase/carnithine racemase